MQWRFRLTSSNNNVAANELLDLPIAVHDPDSESDSILIDKVAKAGNRIVDLKAQARTARTSGGAQQIAHMLASAWDALNDAVYALYGLTKAQRDLVAKRLDKVPLAAQLVDDDDVT